MMIPVRVSRERSLCARIDWSAMPTRLVVEARSPGHRGGHGPPREENEPAGRKVRVSVAETAPSAGARIIVTVGMQTPDPLDSFHAALEARHLSELTFAEVRHALQALSSLYVERRERMAEGAVFDGAGKRAAFALYYGPMHFLLVREIVRGLALRAPRRILDLGCGTGTAGAAWALEGEPRARVEAVDRSGWAVAEARWTWPASASTAARPAATPRPPPCRSRRPASSPRSP